MFTAFKLSTRWLYVAKVRLVDLVCLVLTKETNKQKSYGVYRYEWKQWLLEALSIWGTPFLRILSAYCNRRFGFNTAQHPGMDDLVCILEGNRARSKWIPGFGLGINIHRHLATDLYPIKKPWRFLQSRALFKYAVYLSMEKISVSFPFRTYGLCPTSEQTHPLRQSSHSNPIQRIRGARADWRNQILRLPFLISILWTG